MLPNSFQSVEVVTPTKKLVVSPAIDCSDSYIWLIHTNRDAWHDIEAATP
jgi:hypothetical protein